MIKRYWLLGSTGDIWQVGVTVAEALKVSFGEHESGYRGGLYLRACGAGFEEIIVQDNFEDEEGCLVEADFAEYCTLIYLTQEDLTFALPVMNDISRLRLEEI